MGHAFQKIGAISVADFYTAYVDSFSAAGYSSIFLLPLEPVEAHIKIPYNDPIWGGVHKGGFTKVAGRWKYQNSPNYTTGLIAEHYRTRAEYAALKNLRVIPWINTFSHARYFAQLDMEDMATMNFSEWIPAGTYPKSKLIEWFNGQANVPGFVLATDTSRATTTGCPLPFANSTHPAASQHVAFHGTKNQAALDFFDEYLKIVRDNTTPLPEYVKLGYDELGHGRTSLINYCRSQYFNADRSTSVAESIIDRIKSVKSILGAGTKVILSGDSFVPRDWGEEYGLAGTLPSGEGGVLHKLKQRLAAESISISDVIILPWS